MGRRASSSFTPFLLFPESQNIPIAPSPCWTRDRQEPPLSASATLPVAFTSWVAAPPHLFPNQKPRGTADSQLLSVAPSAHSRSPADITSLSPLQDTSFFPLPSTDATWSDHWAGSRPGTMFLRGQLWPRGWVSLREMWVIARLECLRSRCLSPPALSPPAPKEADNLEALRDDSQ